MTERFGKADFERIGRLLILHLRGTPFERGFQHGSLLRDRIKDTLGFYRSLPLVLASKVSGAKASRLKSISRTLRFLSRRLAGGFSGESLEEIRGLAVGVGVSPEEIAETLLLGDIFQLVGRFSETFRRAGPPVLPGLGCTSVLRESAGNSLFFGRNFDFWGAGYWDANPTVIFHHPDRGKAYCSISSAGIPLAGVTAANEEGLVVAVHQHGSKDASIRGTPVFELMIDVVRRASNVEEAIAVIGSHRSSGGWSLVLAGRNPREAAVVEMSSRKKSVRRISGHSLIATNHFLDPELSRNEVQANLSSTMSDHARYERAALLLRQHIIKPSKVADILADCYDPLAGKERSAGLTISRITTISSAIFNVHSGKFFVSESTAPCSRGGYVGFDLDRELEGRGSSVERLEVSSTMDASLGRARDLYLDAYMEYMHSEDIHRVLALLGECAVADPTEPNFPLMEAIFRIKAGNHKGALRSAETAYELEKVGLKKDLILIWKARILDLMGRREESRNVYSEVIEASASPLLRRKAAANLRRPFSEKQLSRILIDFTNGDTFE